MVTHTEVNHGVQWTTGRRAVGTDGPASAASQAHAACGTTSRRVTRKREDGTVRTMTGRWTLYRLLEHLPWHYGQIQLIRHQYRAARATSAPR